MILDIRYHIASLVAVFLALGLGILIGASLLDEGRLVESQEKLIVGLERRFDGLQAERNLLETEIALLNGRLQEQDALLGALEAPLVEGALAGRTVTLIYGSAEWQKNRQSALDRLLEQAGAQVVSSELLTDLLPNSIMLSSSHGEPDESGDKQKTAESIDSLPLSLKALVRGDQGLLGERRSPRPSPPGHVDMIVLVGSGGDSTAAWEVQLVKEAAAAGVAVGVIGSTTMETLLGELAQGGALVVDNIDSVAGRVGLIRGLVSGNSGYYGVGKGASGLLPRLTGIATPSD